MVPAPTITSHAGDNELRKYIVLLLLKGLLALSECTNKAKNSSTPLTTYVLNKCFKVARMNDLLK